MSRVILLIFYVSAVSLRLASSSSDLYSAPLNLRLDGFFFMEIRWNR